jgi:tryptophan-rich sensory protein
MMNYIYYLKKQLLSFGLVALVYNIAYYFAVFFELRSPGSIPIENIIIFALIYILLGAYLNYSKLFKQLEH